MDTHAANFADVNQYLDDVPATEITRFPRAGLFWASQLSAWGEAS